MRKEEAGASLLRLHFSSSGRAYILPVALGAGFLVALGFGALVALGFGALVALGFGAMVFLAMGADVAAGAADATSGAATNARPRAIVRKRFIRTPIRQ